VETMLKNFRLDATGTGKDNQAGCEHTHIKMCAV